MFERFTDRARRCLQLANRQAQRLNHESYGTEHILMGLLEEGSGIAANVLKNLDVSLHQLEEEIKKMVQAEPDIVTMGKLPMTPRGRQVCEYAIEEARKLSHNYVGTEHLLLGLLREGDGLACQVLLKCGVKLEDVREEILNLLGANIAELRKETSYSGNITADLLALLHDWRNHYGLTYLQESHQLNNYLGKRITDEILRLANKGE